MAYCKNCGAYIPDGQSVCLACGFDETAAASGAAAATAAAGAGRDYSMGSSTLRDQLEQHRREQKEKSERWAEEQYARRQQQARERQWAEEEYARRKAERAEEERKAAEELRKAEEERRKAEEERRAAEAARRRAASTVYRSMGSSAGSSEQGASKLFGALSYLSILWVLPFIFTPNDYFARFHARQGLKLFVLGIIADVVGGLTGFGWVISLFRLYLIYKGMSNALNGRDEPLPYIGNIGDT